MVSVLSAGPALQPRGDRSVDVLRARSGTLAPQPLPQHVLANLIELKGYTEPISDLGHGHHSILLSSAANRRKQARPRRPRPQRALRRTAGLIAVSTSQPEVRSNAASTKMTCPSADRVSSRRRGLPRCPAWFTFMPPTAPGAGLWCRSDACPATSTTRTHSTSGVTSCWTSSRPGSNRRSSPEGSRATPEWRWTAGVAMDWKWGYQDGTSAGGRSLIWTSSCSGGAPASCPAPPEDLPGRASLGSRLHDLPGQPGAAGAWWQHTRPAAALLRSQR